MHWAPIPIIEFALPPPPAEFDITEADILRLLSRSPRRGFWLTAFALIAFLAIGIVASLIGNALVSIVFIALAMFAGTGHILIRHKLNIALRVSREPAAVYWAEPRQVGRQIFWTREPVYSLTLYTPVPVKLDAILSEDELMAVLHWMRQRNPDALIGRFSPTDSDGRLSGNDP